MQGVMHRRKIPAWLRLLVFLCVLSLFVSLFSVLVSVFFSCFASPVACKKPGNVSALIHGILATQKRNRKSVRYHARMFCIRFISGNNVAKILPHALSAGRTDYNLQLRFRSCECVLSVCSCTCSFR